jgi:uncharacterized repeat protein (TIGR03803 family)
MKKINTLRYALSCVVLCVTLANAQQRLMFSRPAYDYGDYTDETNGLYYINKDGSGVPEQATNFLPSRAFGGMSLYFMVSKNGDLVGINGEGGDDPDYANGVRYVVTGKGVVIVDHFGYPLNRSMPLEESPVNDNFYSIGWGASGEYLPLTGTKFTEFTNGYYPNYGLKLNTNHLLVSRAGEVYSTAPIGGTFGQGYVYKWAGPKIEVLYNFSKPTGFYPQGRLLEGADGYLYGMTKRGGTNDFGVIFKVKTDGTDYQVLHSFSKTDGQYPDRGFVQSSSGALYSMTSLGGANNLGVIFRIMPDGTGFKVIHHIAFTRNTSHGFKQNLLLDSYGYLYGKFPAASGTIFRIRTDGTDLKILYDEDITIYNIQLVNSINPAYKVIVPTNGATDVSTSYVFKADSVPCALRYALELSVNANFASPATIMYSPTSQFLVRGLSPLTKYYARVRTSLWLRPGPVTSFTTTANTLASAVTTPADGSSGAPAPTLTVTVKAVTGATTYTVELSESPFFDGTLTIGVTDDSHRTFKMYNIKNNTLYYARVKTDVASGYGKITSFTTAPSTTLASASEPPDETFNVFPNPSNDTFTVTKASNYPDSNSTMELVDFTGNIIERFDLTEGELEFGHDLPKGIYILKTFNAGATIQTRLVKR